MSGDDPLRSRLRKKVHEAEAHEGEIPADQLEAINRLERLVEVRDKTFATPPPRWRIVVVLAAALLVVSLLIFLRVHETEVEMQLVVSEVGFVLARSQAITGIVNLAELEVSGLRGLQLSDPVLSAWSAESAEEQKAVRVAALESGTLTLDPLHLATGIDVRIDADRSPSGCRIVLRGARTAVRATAHGSLQVDLLGSGMRTTAFGIPRPLLFETDPGEVTLDLLFAKGSRAAFSPQLAIHKLALSRIDEFQAQEGTTVEAVSTILSGTIYMESLNGAARPLRPRELLRFDEIRGVIRTLELGDGRIALAFRGTVRGMRSGWGARPVSLMPTWLDWLRARHGLSLLWGTTLFLSGLITEILRWWRVRV
jgi:hypothetical protein